MPLVRDKLNSLLFDLYEEEYFSFMENAESYVNSIYDFIYTIPTLKRKQTKDKKYGSYYCSYKPNKNTPWYITFNKEDDVYFIRNIINNHGRDYPRFIAGL